MFNNDITLNPQSFGGQNEDKVYSLVSVGDTGSLRRVSATSTSTPETLTIGHRSAVEKGLIVNQHMVRTDIILLDPDKGEVKVSAWLVIRVPKGTTVVTTTVIKDQIGRLLAFEQASGALDKILNMEP